MSMRAVTTSFTERASRALQDEFLRRSVQFTTTRLREAKDKSAEALGEWERWREEGRRIRAHTLAHLDFYLDQFSRAAEARGAEVHFAATADEAVQAVLGIARAAGASLVAKSKSMVSEELHINSHLEQHGLECVETDLGEWIIQLAHETPSHLILPAIHKTRGQIQGLFENEGAESLTSDTAVLTDYARRRMREKFAAADIGMSGCNFGIAESGSVVLFTNEGNGRMVTTLPRTHIVIMGMERLIPAWDDLEVMANILPRSGTGQKMTAYMSVFTGPRRAGEGDGPEALHIIIVNNGRSAALGDAEFQEVLQCIRCGACLNVCPVYRHIGGHAYGGVYSGPIGAVLTPLLNTRAREWKELPYASSLCGACADACPVKIPLHDMLVRLRRRHVEMGHATWRERAAFTLFGKIFGSRRAYTAATSLARRVQRLTVGDGRSLMASFMGPLRGWTAQRTLPTPPPQAFRELWPALADENADPNEPGEP